MSMTNRVLRAGVIVLAYLSAGCAFVDQKVPLAYDNAVANVDGGQGQTVLVETPLCAEMDKNKKGLCIVGNVKNTYGMKTADTVTEDSVPDWIADALCMELKAAGFAAQTVDKLPSTASRGISTRVIEVWVEQDPGFWTVGAIGEVQLRMALYRNGKIVKEFDIESKGQGERGIVADSQTKEDSLRTTLEVCMKEALPVIVEAFEEGI